MAFGYDPATSAYLREMGVLEQNIYAEARERSNLAERSYNRTIPLWAERERSAVQGVKDDAETRGVFSSGATLRNAARARANIGMERNEAQAAANDTAIGYGLDAARRVAELRRQQLESGLQAGMTQATAGAQAQYGG